MKQPIPMSTGTQPRLSTVSLTHYQSSVSYNQRGSDTKRCGTPAQSNRFTRIASPEIESSGNTQQHGTETTALLMLADYIGLTLHRDSTPSGTHGAAGQYVLFIEHGWGLDHTKLRGSGRTT